MCIKVSRLVRAKNRFLGESGAASIEAALWLPFFVVLMTLVADAALIFHGQSRALKVMQEANRDYAVGYLATAAETEAQIVTALSQLSANVQAFTTEDEGIITTIVTMPSRDLDAVGFFTSLASVDMKIVSQQVREF